MTNPCYECKKRSPTCHSSCEAYAEMVARYEAIRQERAQHANTMGYVYQRSYKRQRQKLRDRKRGRDV